MRGLRRRCARSKATNQMYMLANALLLKILRNWTFSLLNASNHAPKEERPVGCANTAAAAWFPDAKRRWRRGGKRVVLQTGSSSPPTSAASLSFLH